MEILQVLGYVVVFCGIAPFVLILGTGLATVILLKVIDKQM